MNHEDEDLEQYAIDCLTFDLCSSSESESPPGGVGERLEHLVAVVDVCYQLKLYPEDLLIACVKSTRQEVNSMMIMIEVVVMIMVVKYLKQK